MKRERKGEEKRKVAPLGVLGYRKERKEFHSFPLFFFFFFLEQIPFFFFPFLCLVYQGERNEMCVFLPLFPYLPMTFFPLFYYIIFCKFSDFFFPFQILHLVIRLIIIFIYIGIISKKVTSFFNL